MFEKIKQILSDDTVFYSLVVVLVGISAFGLGKHSMTMPDSATRSAGVVFSQPSRASATAEVNVVERNPEQQLVASKNGTKYHLPWCPGASQMKEENKVWFESEAEARAAGYSPAGNCQGL